MTFTQDKSKVIRQMLSDLQNSVITGVLLVAVIILFALGFRASLFIGIAIPASFLAGVLGLQLAGLTVNIVVLFSLILAVGMLVDDAIIVSEFAERRMAEGMPPKEAYSLAAKRMSGPVIAATATRVAAFSPLLFWPGVVGEFMKYLPITLIATLSASLAVALFFTPTLGALLGKASADPARRRAREDGPYMRAVRLALRRPGATLGLAALLLVVVQVGYAKFGRGVEFFPGVEPDYGQVIVHARGNLSLDEKNRLLAEAEKRVLEPRGSRRFTPASASSRRGSNELSEDTIGVIQFEFADWRTRPPAHEIMDGIRDGDRRQSRASWSRSRRRAPARRPASRSRSSSPRSIPTVLPAAAKKVAAMLSRASRISRTSTTACRCPASTGRSCRSGGGRQVRRQSRDRRHARCNSSPTASRPPNIARPAATRPSISWCAFRKTAAASIRSTSCACRRRRLRSDQQFRRTRGGAARRLHQPRRRQPRHDGVGERRRGRADRQGAAGDRQGTGHGRSRPRRHLAS